MKKNAILAHGNYAPLCIKFTINFAHRILKAVMFVHLQSGFCIIKCYEFPVTFESLAFKSQGVIKHLVSSTGMKIAGK